MAPPGSAAMLNRAKLRKTAPDCRLQTDASHTVIHGSKARLRGGLLELVEASAAGLSVSAQAADETPKGSPTAATARKESRLVTKARAGIDGNSWRMAWNPSTPKRGKRARVTSHRADLSAVA